MSLSEAIKSATTFRRRFDPGDVIDHASSFSAFHFDMLIEWASTCSEFVATADEEDSLREMDVTQLGDAGLAHFYFSELEIDPDLQGKTGVSLRQEIEWRGLSDEQLAAHIERARQTHEAAASIETAEREAPPHFPDDVEIPERH